MSASGSTLDIGDVTVARVVEWTGPLFPSRQFVPNVDERRWDATADHLPVAFWGGDGTWRCAMQSWVLVSEGRTILVDTCVGHHPDGLMAGIFGGRENPYLENLAAAGLTPADIDVVVITHLHQDHVGWNTRWEHDEWVPTFPNATYVFARADVDDAAPAHGDGDDEGEKLLRADSDRMYRESIEPLLRRGMTTLWEGTHRIDDTVTLEAAPGHTPGSAVLRVASGGALGLFVGDVLHIPVQILDPDANSSVCRDPDTARRTRRRLLGEAADAQALIFPAHFVGPGAVSVRRDGDTFAIDRWAPLESI